MYLGRQVGCGAGARCGWDGGMKEGRKVERESRFIIQLMLLYLHNIIFSFYYVQVFLFFFLPNYEYIFRNVKGMYFYQHSPIRAEVICVSLSYWTFNLSLYLNIIESHQAIISSAWLLILCCFLFDYYIYLLCIYFKHNNFHYIASL